MHQYEHYLRRIRATLQTQCQLSSLITPMLRSLGARVIIEAHAISLSLKVVTATSPQAARTQAARH
jgi:hypothetical protein